MRWQSNLIACYLAELTEKQLICRACGFEACFPLRSLLGCCRRPRLRRRPWSMVQEAPRRRATSCETTLYTGTRTAVAENTATMPDLFELDGARWASLARCFPSACGGLGRGSKRTASWRTAGLRPCRNMGASSADGTYSERLGRWHGLRLPGQVFSETLLDAPGLLQERSFVVPIWRCTQAWAPSQRPQSQGARART